MRHDKGGWLQKVENGCTTSLKRHLDFEEKQKVVMLGNHVKLGAFFSQLTTVLADAWSINPRTLQNYDKKDRIQEGKTRPWSVEKKRQGNDKRH